MPARNPASHARCTGVAVPTTRLRASMSSSVKGAAFGIVRKLICQPYFQSIRAYGAARPYSLCIIAIHALKYCQINKYNIKYMCYIYLIAWPDKNKPCRMGGPDSWANREEAKRDRLRRSGFPGLKRPLELHHAAEPAVVVLGLVAHVLRDLRMRQDQKSLGFEAFDHGVSALLRREHPVEMLRAVRAAAQQRRVDALRAEHRNANALVAMGNGEDFAESHRRVLGRRVNGAANLREQPRRRSRVEKIAAAARDHARQ